MASLPEAGAVVTVDHVRGRGRHNPALGRHRARECGLNFSSQQLLLFVQGFLWDRLEVSGILCPQGTAVNQWLTGVGEKVPPASSPTSQGSYEALSCSPVWTSPEH